MSLTPFYTDYPPDAVRHFETALAVGTRMRARPWLARTQYEYARLLLARAESGDRDRARALYTAQHWQPRRCSRCHC